MKQIVPCLLLLAFTATLLNSCKDVDMPTAPPENPNFLVNIKIMQDDSEVELVNAGDTFIVEATVIEVNDNIKVQGVEIELAGGSFVDDNNDLIDIDLAETNSDGIATFDNLRIIEAKNYELKVISDNSEVSNEVVPELTVLPAVPNLKETIVLIDGDNISDNNVSIPYGSTKEIQVQVRDIFKNLRSDSNDPLSIKIDYPDGDTIISKNGDNEGIAFNSDEGVFVVRKQFDNAGDNGISVSFDESSTVNFDENGFKGTINVIEPEPNKITIVQGTLSDVNAGGNISNTENPIQVKVKDESDNPVPGITVSYSLLKSNDDEETFTEVESTSGESTTGDHRTATFENIIIDDPGTYKLRFEVDGFENVESIDTDTFEVKDENGGNGGNGNGNTNGE